MMDLNTVLPFSSKEYSKFDYAVFPTIRRRDKYGEVGDVNEIKAGEKGSRDRLGYARIVAKEKKSLNDMSTQFLLHDTESRNWDAAYESLNRFYRNPIECDEELTIYWNAWVEHDG